MIQETLLPSRCLAMDGRSDSDIPTFSSTPQYETQPVTWSTQCHFTRDLEDWNKIRTGFILHIGCLSTSLYKSQGRRSENESSTKYSSRIKWKRKGYRRQLCSINQNDSLGIVGLSLCCRKGSDCCKGDWGEMERDYLTAWELLMREGSSLLWPRFELGHSEDSKTQYSVYTFGKLRSALPVAMQ
jgi:hypothetical protein